MTQVSIKPQRISYKSNIHTEMHWSPLI